MPFSRPLLAAALAAFLAGPAGAGPMMTGAGALEPRAAAAVVAQLLNARAARGLCADHGVEILRQHPGADGTTVIRVVDTYKGVPVFGSEAAVVASPAGAILAEERSERSAGLGTGRANPLAAVTANFDVQPKVPAARAIAAVVADLPSPGREVRAPLAQLIIYPLMRTVRTAAAAAKPDEQLNALDVEEVVAGYELAWLVQVRVLGPRAPMYVDRVVSALDGHTIAQWNALQTAVGVGHSQYNGDVPINASMKGQLWRLVDPARGKGGPYGANAVTNANHGDTAGAVYTNPTNTWGDGKQYVEKGSTTSANGQTAAVNAMWGMMNTYDMLKNALGWQSLDGRDSATYIAAHVNSAYDNAYYDDACRCMYIGDGSFFNSLGSIDVIGHEMSHGVTAATANLRYAGESGGLNESSSDIGGEVVEAYARAGAQGAAIPATGNDWVLGQEISKTGQPLRWMYRPSLDQRSPDAWSLTLGSLDVHYSSGPNNRMFYFLAQGSNADPASDRYSRFLTARPAAMTGIGLDAAYRIWFRALSTKFTSTTNYAQARALVLAAAQELYGKTSKQAVAVQRAYAAINVGPDIDEPDGQGAAGLAAALQ